VDLPAAELMGPRGSIPQSAKFNEGREKMLETIMDIMVIILLGSFTLFILAAAVALIKMIFEP